MLSASNVHRKLSRTNLDYVKTGLVMLVEKAVIWTILFFFKGSVSNAQEQEPSYLVLVPSMIRPGRPYDISVQIFKPGGEITVKAEILSKKNDTIVSNEETFQGKSQFTISLDVPVRNYKFRHLVRVQGKGAVNFFNETFVEVSRKTVIILIQTDKAIYKPGQIVRFRCMAVYSDLKPFLGKFDITFTDPNRNKMAQWNNVKGSFGVFGDEFQLASSPPLGSWRIAVTIKSGEANSKSFTVKEFVLPKVEVKMDLPTFFHRSRIPLVATISAMYTFGKPLSGKARVILSAESIRYNKKSFKKIVRKVTLENGKKDIKYRKEDLEQLYFCTSTPRLCKRRKPLVQLRGRRLNITAIITDDITGDKHRIEKSITIESNLFRLQFLEITPRTFKDGLTWKGFLQLTLPDGSPPKSSDTKEKLLNVTYEFRGREVRKDGLELSFRRSILQRYTVPQNGIVVVQIEIPQGMSACDINARFPSKPFVVTATRSMEKYLSRDDEALQLSIPDIDGAVEPGDSVKIVLTSTVSVDHYYYQLISKGRIVLQSNQKGSGTNNSLSITFNPALAQKTAPSARVVVWFQTKDQEIIVDSIEFNVKGAFANKVALSFSKDEVKPADNITLMVKTHRNSFVGMLAVDQSILLLKQGNDITQTQVLNELRRFSSGSSSVSSFSCRYCYFPRSLGGENAKEVFENAGVQVMTDFYVHDVSILNHGCYGPQRFFPNPRFAFRSRAEGAASAPQPGPSPSGPSPGSGPAPPPPLAEPERVRDLFPETWIWTDDISGSDGKVTLSATAPDTITSWVASAFSMNEDVGLGIAEETTKLTVFKAFFAQIDLPFSAIRGETLELKVLVFNFLESPQKVTITLEKPPNNEFYAREENEEKATQVKEIVQQVEVKAGDGVEVSFWIRPAKLGQVPVEVKAQSTQAADALRRMLLVEPEGVPQVYTKSFFINVNASKSFQEDVEILFPADVVQGSAQVLFSATGDIMGPSMRNLDGLLRMPYGCGEQNMLNFAPNIFVLDYLNATNQLKGDIANKAKGFMRKGYQNQLRYQRFDGSFSAFGNRDRAGSMWLTAFVVRSFHSAKRYTTIEQSIIDKGLEFILRHKSDDGSFKEPTGGEVMNTDMQGGASKGTPLTAYVLASLIELKDSIEDEGLSKEVNDAIKKTLKHLVQKLPKVKKNVYAMALITFALTLYGHPKAKEAFMSFDKLASTNSADGTKFWIRDEPDIVIKFFWRPPYRRRPSNSIEMTAYGACINLLRNDMDEAESIIKWLSSQRNSFGGYRSTQDTVLGINALAKFAAGFRREGKQSVDVTVADKKEYNFDTITKANFDVLQQIEVESTGPKMVVKAKGNGAALVQMSVFYNKKENKDVTGFKLTVASHYVSFGTLKTRICFKYTVPNIESGMVVLQMNQLTGHVPITSFLLSQFRGLGLKRWEILRGKKLALYFDKVRDQPICIVIISVISQRVRDLQHAVIEIFSYYRTEVTDTKLYLPGVGDGVNLPLDCKNNLRKCDVVVSSSGKGEASFKNGDIQLKLLRGNVDANDFASFATPIISNHSGKICVESSAKVSAGESVTLTFEGKNVKKVEVKVSATFEPIKPVELEFEAGVVIITLGGIEEDLEETITVVVNKLNVSKGRC